MKIEDSDTTGMHLEDNWFTVDWANATIEVDWSYTVDGWFNKGFITR